MTRTNPVQDLGSAASHRAIVAAPVGPNATVDAALREMDAKIAAQERTKREEALTRAVR